VTNRDENNAKKIPKGIPPDHPSIGKNVRDAVEGPSWPEIKDHGGGRMMTRGHELVWAILLAIWIIYTRFWFISPYFKDPDAAKLAFGLGQRLQGVGFADGEFYQLGKILGSYFIYETLARIFSVEIYELPHFMAMVNASFMVGILVLNYFLARMIWGLRVGLISTTLLAISPMMWITGQYPTTVVPALFFFMLAVWAMVMSYRVKGGRWWAVLAGLLFGWAIMVRLDMALGMLVPICYAFFVDRRGLRRAFIIYAISLVTYGIGAWVLISNGYTFADILSVGPHSPDYPKSLLLNIWGMGPFLFVFAFSGFVYRFATDRKPLPFIFFWIVGFNTFYTGHLYSPSYFISYYPVVCWLAAFSIIAFYGWLVKLVKFNRPMRIVFMVLICMGATTMLTHSTVKEGDGPVQIKYADTISYSRDTGLHPTGSVWFYMHNFKNGVGFKDAWLELSARSLTFGLFRTNGEAFEFDDSAMFIGSESTDYLNFYLLADGWKYETKRGDFNNFYQGGVGNQYVMQTAKQGDEPVGAFEFLSNPPRGMNVYIGSDAIPHFIDLEGEVGAPTLLTFAGWHRKFSREGLDIIVPGPLGGQADGTLNCETELYRFFNTDAIPHNHVKLILTGSGPGVPKGWVTSHNGDERYFGTMGYLERVSEVEWQSVTAPQRWLALAINHDTLGRGYTLYVNREELESPEYLGENLAGFGSNRWDIVLVPPDRITSIITEFKLEAQVRGGIFDIYSCQRTYPDCQYRNETARELDLEFQDIDCIR